MITKFNFSELFSKAWLKTCSPDIICSGFRRAGVIPFNPEALMKRIPSNNEDRNIGCSNGSVGSDLSDNLMDVSEHSSEGCVSGNDSTAILRFSSEEEDLYSRRFEEGYDLPDDRYCQWLCLYHPEVSSALQPLLADSFIDVEPAISSNSQSTSAPLFGTPSRSSTQSTFSFKSPPRNTTSGSTSPLASETPPSNPSPDALVPETPPTYSVSPSPIQRRLLLAPIVNRSPCNASSQSSMTSGTSFKIGSPLSKYLQPIESLESKGKTTGHARVLTSAECIEMISEKKEKREKEEEEK